MCCCMAVATLMFMPFRANANVTYNISMVDGASVRTDESKAIRFQTLVEKEQVTADMKIVTIIANTADLVANGLNDADGFTRENLVDKNVNYFSVEFSDAYNNLFYEDGVKIETVKGVEYYAYNACIYEILEKNYYVVRSARSYIQIGNEIVQYTDYSAENNSRSYAEVAYNYLDKNDVPADSTAYSNLEKIVASGVKYELNATNDAYVVTGLAEGNFIKGELFILGYYNKLPVTTIGANAFRETNIVKAVINKNVTTLDHRAFMWARSLETLIAPGVNTFKAESGDGRFQFYECKALKQVVLSDELAGIQVNVFHDATADLVPQADLFFYSEVTLNINPGNQLLTKEVYVYNENEEVHGKFWHFNNNGEIVKAAQHSFNDAGKCSCGAYNTQGGLYEWDGVDAYVFAGLSDNSLTEINVIGVYNDGIHNEANVTSVKAKAINKNNTLRKIVLHENIKTINTNAFMQCYALEYVDARGVTTLSGNAHFAYDHSLRTVILSDSLTTYGDLSFYDDASPYANNTSVNTPQADNTLDILLYNENGATSTLTKTGRNNMIKAFYLYTPEDNLCGNYWNYNNDGVAQILEHSFNDHSKCTRCGSYNTQGVKYDWNGETYTATGLTDSSVTEINVIGWYDDGTHGEQQVTKIGAKAFYDNDKIVKAVIHENVKTMEHRAFMFCDKLTTVIAPGIVVFKSEADGSDGRFQFYECKSLTTVVLSSDIGGIQSRIFYDDKDNRSTVDLLFYADKTSLNIENNNHMLQGGNIYNYYRYGETPTTAGYWWTIDTNGDIVKTIIE